LIPVPLDELRPPGAAPPGLGTAGVVLLALAGGAALADWLAVARGIKPLEYVAKPLTIALLLGVAAALTPVDDVRRDYFAAALVLSLAGDVVLMLPGDLLLAGLGAFLVAHVDYILGLRHDGPDVGSLALALLGVAVLTLPLGGRIAVALAASGQSELRLAVIAYVFVLSVMVAFALATGSLLASAGAWLFLASDALLAWDRFVQPLRHSRLGVIVTYHLAQALLVVSLTR